MALIRWEPVRELNTIQSEMNRLFNTFFDTPTSANGGSATSRRWIPAMDLAEAENEYVLRLDLPGLSEQDVSVELDENVLTISGERTAQHEERKGGYYRVERGFGHFSRSLTLPEGIDPESIRASFELGVLEVQVPKPRERQPRKVAIKVGAGAQAPAIEGSESTEGTEPADGAGS
jgi:HSP20 family protein